MDKPKPDFSNVVTGGSSTAPQAKPQPPAQPEAATYVVAKGDTLSKIAQHQYGKASAWRRIFEANQDLIKNPDLIYPGQVLKIPRP
jgi:nucleoid-associated protein YgaU